jgi:predicted acyl esterase
MDLFAFVQKLDTNGNFVPALVLGARNFGATGRLRVSHRQLDPARSTPAEPYLTHRVEELLSSGQVVPVEIAIWPTGMLWHAGEQLCLIIAGYNLAPEPFPGIEPPKLRNKGEHIIHTGGKYDSHLLVPVILKSPPLGGV